MKASSVLPFLPGVGVDRSETPSAQDELVTRFHVTSGTIALAVVAIGAATLAGWWFDVPALTSVFPDFASMKVNGALSLVLSGVSLWCYRSRAFSPRRDVVLKATIAIAAAIAAATVFEYVTGWDLGIDQVLMADRGAAAGAPPGRMSLSSAVCLLLLNGAMFIAQAPGRYGLAQGLAASAGLLATLSGVGYFFGVTSFAGLTEYGAMAVHMAVALLLLCVGFFFARPDEGLMEAVTDPGAGGLAIRQLLPVVFALPVLLAWLSWQGVVAGWYQPAFAIAVFVALSANVLGYAVWAGGNVLRGFDGQRAAAEAERLQSEERLRRAVADAPVPMIIHDSEGRILHMSRGWSERSGHTIAETPTLSSWIAATRPTGETDLDAHFSRVGRGTETAHGGEWVITARTGEARVWEFTTTPLGAMDATRRALVTMAIDITERKQAESDLRQINESLEQRIAARTAELTAANDALKRQSDQLKEQAMLLDLVRDGILVRDLYGTIVYWSAGAAEMYGWDRSKALGAVSHTLLKAEYPLPLADIETLVMQAGHWEGEVVHTTANGERLRVETRWTLTRTERGVPQGFLEVNRDITARMRAQESLQDSERRFRAVAETAIEGIISVDEAGAIAYWNPGAARLFGRTAAEAAGQPIAIALPDPALPFATSSGRAAHVGSTVETVGRRKDGSEFPLELSLSTWTTSQGARFVTGIARDITARKQAERDLEAKAAELSRSNQELEQFAYVASHDLQEPLRMVSNYTQLLGRRYKDQLDQDANEFIAFAVDGARRMQDLIRDLLEYARVGTRGKEFKPVAVERLLGDALVNLSSAIEESHAQVLSHTLPTIVCDASQMTQVFQNLIGNAIKFRRPGTRPVVRVTARREGHAWAIAIADNGIGIEPKYFDRIFQMFQRLHGRDQYAGTGIGLALCRKIVERHGGRIRVDSVFGQGATFSVVLPDPPAKAASA